MVQVVEMTREEKMKMYMKLPKKQLAEMLIDANILLEFVPPIVSCTRGNGDDLMILEGRSMTWFERLKNIFIKINLYEI